VTAHARDGVTRLFPLIGRSIAAPLDALREVPAR
jgi:hypothetical protein